MGRIFAVQVVYNTMLASTCALDMGIEIDKVREGIFSTDKISGRLEKVRDNIFIDYAHTPLAIESALKSIKKIAPQKRIISLFGCGGDRDKEKRPKMGKIATQLSDFTIITSDNSRSESLTNIFIDILSGIDDTVEFCLIPNRKDAIKYGISILKDNDIFILFGKGHENYEITKKGKSYFSEKDIINDAVREKYF
jgi:UDP-N-acetylmuramoyl-L-alanyl-D-glutamate--2,6-diaminopimelate ligase